jgi:hypothetical protein
MVRIIGGLTLEFTGRPEDFVTAARLLYRSTSNNHDSRFLFFI